jgi:hypothetical protein
MKQAGLIVVIIIAAAFSSCGPSIKTTASWVNKEKIKEKHYKNIFIVALLRNLQAKTTLENDLANAAEARGIKAYKSIDVFGPTIQKEILPLKEDVEKKLAELNCDAIFTVALVDKQSETRFVPGSYPNYMPYTTYGYYRYFGGYYGYGAGFYDQGYYTTDKTYFIESNLYDAKTEELMLSIQSQAVNPSGIEKSSKEYTQTLIEEVKKLGLSKN